MKTICAVIALVMLSGCTGWNRMHRMQAEAEPAAVDWLELFRHAGAVAPLLVVFWTMWKYTRKYEEREQEREDEARRQLDELRRERETFHVAVAMGYVPPSPPQEPGSVIRGEGPCGPTSRPLEPWEKLATFTAEANAEKWKCSHCGGKWSAEREACPAWGAAEMKNAMSSIISKRIAKAGESETKKANA